MNLTAIYTYLSQRSAATGEVRRADLPNGARIAVLVANNQVTITFARRQQRVGVTEEVTFKRHCHVPDAARRIPPEGQQTRQAGHETWYLIGYRWEGTESGGRGQESGG